jgi:hypothetical protein
MGFFLAPICYGSMAWLLSRRLPVGALGATLVVLAGFVLGLLATLFLRVVMTVCNLGLRKQPGASVGRAASEGALVLLPFTVHAILAEVLLGWSAVQVFASAGTMASAAAMGAAAMKQGGGRWANTLGPSLGGMVLSAAWMTFCAIAALLGSR